MIKLYYNLTTFQYIGKDSGSETWVQGDDDSKSLALYFGSGADVANFVNGLTSTTIYAKECSLNVERPDETTATLAATAIVSGTDIYYKIVVDSWVCEQEGLLSLTAVLKTATTTQAYGLATQAVAAGAAPSVETITTAQYNTLVSNYNTLNSLKLNAAVKGYYKASDFALTGTMTTEAYVEAVYAALIDAEGDYALDTIAHILNDCVTLSDLPATGASDVLLILQFEDEAGTAAKRAQLIARGSTASDWLYYAFVNSSVDTGFSGWNRYLNDTDLTTVNSAIDAIKAGTQAITYDNSTSGTIATTVKTAIDELDSEIDDIKDGTTVVSKATGDKDGNQIDTTYLKKSGGTMAGAINMGAQKIMNMADGANVAEAVTKGQLDTGLALKENLANKVQEVVAGGTGSQYVSAAALYVEFLKKVDKAFTIAGLNMQSGSITLSALKTAIGEATTSANGLLSASDKTLIDVLRASYSDDDGNSLVDTIKEVLTAFEGYPESTDLMAYFATKVDKVEGKALSENDLTDELKIQYDDAVTHANKTDGTNPHLTTYDNLAGKPTTFEGFGLKNGSVETITVTTSVTTPKVILATGVYIQYNSTDDSIDFVFPE